MQGSWKIGTFYYISQGSCGKTQISHHILKKVRHILEK